MRKILAYAFATVLLIMLACSNRDDRNQIRDRNGEPDAKDAQGKDIFWREYWFYSSAGVGYEFRRNAGCGSYHDVYLYNQFYFQPDTSGAALSRKPHEIDPNLPNKLSTEPRDRVIAPY